MCKMTVLEYSLTDAASTEPAAPAGPTEEEKEAAYKAWCGVKSEALPQRQHPV